MSIFGGGLYGGLIDEFAVYDKALSAAEIAAHFAASQTLPPQIPEPSTLLLLGLGALGLAGRTRRRSRKA